MNELHFGDNLDVLRAMRPETVDFIYLDPPFNSNAAYNVLYGTKRGGASEAQSHAFEDTWRWGPKARKALDETAERHMAAGNILDAFQSVFPDSSMLAYLSMMAVRLIEMHRILKDTGSLFLHCDPTASHYLKILLDSIFGVANYRNEIVWKRTTAHSSSKKFAPVHDIILYFVKSDRSTWNDTRVDYDPAYLDKYYRFDDGDGRLYWRSDITGAGVRKGDSGLPWKDRNPTDINRHWALPEKVIVGLVGVDKARSMTAQQKLDALEANKYIYWPKGNGMPQIKRFRDQLQGVALSDTWDDLSRINPVGGERIGYPTQKPVALIDRLIAATTKEGDIVLDPFCGCGTAIASAESLRRQWIGIDVTYLAIHIIESRLVRKFGEEIKGKYRLYGRPEDVESADALAARDWLEFQKWAVFKLGGLPKDKAGPDGGIDGIIRYHRVGIEQPNRAIVSVKGGLNVGVDAIHKLKSVMDREKAEMGVLVCINPPTKAMRHEAVSAGEVGPTSRRVARIQIVTTAQLFHKHPVEYPGMIDPPDVLRASPPSVSRTKRKRDLAQTEMLFPLVADEQRSTDKAASSKALKGKGSRSIRPTNIEVTRALPLKRNAG